MPLLAGTGGAVVLRRCDPADVPAVEALVRAAGLPGDGVREAFAAGCVATAADGSIIGAAAVEPYGEVALLRSVVVAEAARGTGLGTQLVHGAEAIARDLGIRELYLLTETATAWFPRLGYRPVVRAEAPLALAASAEFTEACAATAVLMHRHLED
jgi:amino-acid N-acetyltransferase